MYKSILFIVSIFLTCFSSLQAFAEVDGDIKCFMAKGFSFNTMEPYVLCKQGGKSVNTPSLIAKETQIKKAIVTAMCDKSVTSVSKEVEVSFTDANSEGQYLNLITDIKSNKTVMGEFLKRNTDFQASRFEGANPECYLRLQGVAIQEPEVGEEFCIQKLDQKPLADDEKFLRCFKNISGLSCRISNPVDQLRDLGRKLKPN